MRFMHSVKDWSAAHERELKRKRQSDEFLKNKIDEIDEIDESFLEDQDLVAALSNAEQDATRAPQRRTIRRDPTPAWAHTRRQQAPRGPAAQGSPSSPAANGR